MKRFIFDLIFSKKFLIALAIVGVALLLNRYSILLDFLLGLLILLVTVFVVIGLLANTKVMDKAKIMIGKLFSKAAR